MGNTLLNSPYVYANTYAPTGVTPTTSATDGFDLKDTTGVSVLCYGIGGNLGATGSLLCYVYDSTFGLPATGTVTCANVSAADTVTINGIVLTAVNGGSPTSEQFDMSGTDTADAASLVSTINSHATLSKYVSANQKATPDGVVYITALTGGTGGNAYTLASSNGTRLAVSGAVLSGGTAAAWARCPELDLSVTVTGATTQLFGALEVPMPRTSRVLWIPSAVTGPTNVHIKILGSLRFPFNKY